MGLENRHIELIDKYLNNELSKTERIEVDALLETDLEFKKEVETHKAILRGISILGEEELRKTLHLEHKKFKIKETRHLVKVKKLFLIGASGLFCLVLGIVVILNPSKNAHDRINKNRVKVFSYKEKFHNHNKNIPRIDSSITEEHANHKPSFYKKLIKENHYEVIKSQFLTVESHAPITHTSYTWIDQEMHLYGKELSNNTFLFKRKDQFYLFDKNKFYPIERTEEQTQLNQTHLRVTESAIHKNPTSTILVTQHLFEQLPNELTVTIHLTDQKSTDSLYTFHNQILTIGENTFNSLFPDTIEILYFNDHFFIDHNHYLYTLDDGDKLKFTEKNIDHDIRSIISPTVTEIDLIDNTIEQQIELESSN